MAPVNPYHVEHIAMASEKASRLMDLRFGVAVFSRGIPRFMQIWAGFGLGLLGGGFTAPGRGALLEEPDEEGLPGLF
jgi:hypothetical protein